MKIKRNYSLIPIIVFAFAALGSIFTSGGMERYSQLILPKGTLSSSFVGTVWIVVYFCIMLCLLFIWNSTKHDKKFWYIIGLFVINGILNVGWNRLFFTSHWLGISIWTMFLIWILTMIKIILIWPRHRLASIFLWIYPLWLIIVGLSYRKIWMIN